MNNGTENILQYSRLHHLVPAMQFIYIKWDKVHNLCILICCQAEILQTQDFEANILILKTQENQLGQLFLWSRHKNGSNSATDVNDKCCTMRGPKMKKILYAHLQYFSTIDWFSTEWLKMKLMNLLYKIPLHIKILNTLASPLFSP